MALFSSFSISGSGLTAQRLRMDLIANNIANAQTTSTPEGGPYKRQVPIFQSNASPGFGSYMSRSLGTNSAGGVKVNGIRHDNSQSKLVYDPDHPDADERGYVAYPNVDIVKEMVDMIGASRAYQANVTAINSAKNMAVKALEIGR